MRISTTQRPVHLLLALAALPALLLSSPAQAQSAPSLWDTFGFPDHLGFLSCVDRRANEDLTRCVTATYAGNGRVATLCAYDRGLPDRPGETPKWLVRDALVESCHDLEAKVLAGVYRTAAIRDTSQVTVRLAWCDVECLRATFDIERAETPTEPAERITSYLFLTAMDGVLFGELYTHAADVNDGEEAEKALIDFAGALTLHHLDKDWITADDFRRAEPKVRRVAQWLVDNLLYPPDTLRSASAAYVASWIIHNPYLRAPVETGHLPLAMRDGGCECDDLVETMYIIGCGLHLMDEPTSSDAAARLAGVEYALDVQAKAAAAGCERSGCAGLGPLIRAREAGTLAAMLEQETR